MLLDFFIKYICVPFVFVWIILAALSAIMFFICVLYSTFSKNANKWHGWFFF